MFSSPLLPRVFLIVDESGNSRGDVHHNIAGPLFSCLGSFFSNLFSSSRHEPVSYRPIASYYPDLSSSYHPSPSSLYHAGSSSSYCPGPSPLYYPHPSSPYRPVSSSSRPVHPSRPSQLSSLSPKSEKSREELDRREEFPAVQARPSVQASSEKNMKLQKNHPALDQASCILSSLTGNQCGSSSYTLSHEPVTVKVYSSQAFHHLPVKPPEPVLGHMSPKPPENSEIHGTSAGQLSHLRSLSTAQLLAQAHRLSGLPPVRPIPPEQNKSPEPAEPMKPPELKSPEPKKPFFDALTSARYKKAANRIRPVWTTLPEEYRILRRIPSDPLMSLPSLPRQPPEFVPSENFTEERKEKMDINPSVFLWPEEEKLMLFLIKAQEAAIAWDPTKCGNFRKDYFEPVVIPTVEHIPWVERNIPIPPGIYDEVVRIIKEKIKVGVYERSNSSYRSKWFCVLKKDGKSLRIVHDLQPLNAVTIKDSGAPPILEFYADNLGGRGSYTGLDLFVAFDHRTLAVQSRDLTTFQTPLGLLRLTTLPMGATNLVQILQGDISFIIQDEMPDIATAFMDDVNVKGPPTRYETNSLGWYVSTAFADPPPQSSPVPCALSSEDQHFEVISENPGIRRFVWEHLNDVNQVLQRVKKAGSTFSGWKMDICVPEVVAVGHCCTYEGHYPEDQKVQKIWIGPTALPLPRSGVFLGVCGIVRIWVKDFAKRAKPLVILTKKDVDFVWGPDQKSSMEDLKQAIVTAPCLHPINYHSDRCVILAVNSSCIATGFILLQLGADNKRYPSQFSSITWN